MPLNDRDAAYLWDMLEAAKEVYTMTHRHGLESFLQDRVLQLALERCLELLGEAARRVSPDGHRALPNIEWRKIIGMRNILAHEYGQIDHDILYSTATQEIPHLIATLVILEPQIEKASDEAAFERRAAEPELSLDELLKTLNKPNV